MTEEPIHQALFEGQGRFIELPEGMIKMMTEQQATKTNATLYGEGGVAVLPETCVMDVVAQNRAAGFLEMNPLAQSDLCLIPVKLPKQLTMYYRTAKTIEV